MEYIGEGVYIRYISPSIMWKDAPDPCGVIIGFERPEGNCEGIVRWHRSPDDMKYGRPTWELISANPLTLSPSIQCPQHSEEHGFIREGKWVPA